jgi:hypothetical protein
VLAAGLLACGPARAGDGPPPPLAWSGDPAGLRLLGVCELDDLFRRSTVHEVPHGRMPGEVLVFTNVPAADWLKRVANDHWKGKIVEPDGSFTNQWKTRQALASCLRVGPSLLDGGPCIICEYPRWTPLFGPMRDEYREVAPGVFLGRQYRRVPRVRFLGYNFLRLSGCGDGESGVLPQEADPGAPAGAGGPAGTGSYFDPRMSRKN